MHDKVIHQLDQFISMAGYMIQVHQYQILLKFNDFNHRYNNNSVSGDFRQQAHLCRIFIKKDMIILR